MGSFGHLDTGQPGVDRLAVQIAKILSKSDASLSLPPMSPALLAAVEPAKSRLVFPEGGGYRQVEKWEARDLDQATTREAQTYLVGLEAALTPAERGRLLARVLALLSHYRSDPHPSMVEQAIADDWAEDLGCFPMWAVEVAAKQWRTTKKFKPTICEMVDLCDHAVRDSLQIRDRLRRLVDHASCDDREAEMRDKVHRLAAETFRGKSGSRFRVAG